MTTPGLGVEITVRRSDAFRLDLAMDIPPATTVALLGPNGAGKSTAVAAVAGLAPIETGRVELAGTVLDDPVTGVFVPPEERRIGVVFQDYVLFPHLDVVDNVAFGLRSRGVGRSDADDRARHWIHRLDLDGVADKMPSTLSGGQAQRVALARALVTEPDLLLLDEPLGALDVTTRSRLRRTLAEHLDAFPGPRLLITHDPAEAFLLADEIHVLEHGSVVQSGSPEDIRLRPRSPFVADLAGSNLFFGVASDGMVDAGGHSLHIADHSVSDDVLVTIHPRAVAVYRRRPEGSPRNSWETTVEVLEHFGERVRLQAGPPLPLTVEVTEAAATALGLEAGSRIWVSVKATEIGVEEGDPIRRQR